MDSLNEFISKSNKKVDISTFIIDGNMNDVGKVDLELMLWCDFKYEYK